MDERQTTSESTAELLGALTRYFPGAIDSINSKVADTAKAQLEADKIVSPGYAQLNADLYSKYAPYLNKIGSEIDASNQKKASETELALAQGTGRDLVKEADLAQRTLDPESYVLRERLGKDIGTYLTNAGPGVTANEREELQRAVAGKTVNPLSAIDTAANAMKFGKQATEKNIAFGEAISRAAAAIPAMKSGISGFEVSTRRALTPNSGNAVNTAATQGAGAQNTFGFGGQFLNNVGAINQQVMGKQLSMWDKLNNVNNYIGTAANVGKSAFGAGGFGV